MGDLDKVCLFYYEDTNQALTYKSSAAVQETQNYCNECKNHLHSMQMQAT